MQRRRLRRAFTLIELLAVIALVAILTAGVAVSLAGAARNARLDDVVDQYVAFDRSTREVARRFERPRALQFSLNRGAVRRTNGDEEPTPANLSGGVRVTRLALAGGERFQQSGEETIRFSPRGQAPSYAVLLESPAGGRKWIVFAGLTGHATVTTDERDVRDILSLATPAAGGD